MSALRTIESKPYVSPLTVYATLMFFLCLGDAIMSYLSPVYIESNVKSPFLMGLILSTSSMIGVIYDIYISNNQWSRGYRYFTRTTIVLAVMFPIVFIIFPAHLITFLVGMVLWGAYYEYRGFSNFNFIHHFLTKDQHSVGWGVVLSSMSFAYLLGAAISSNIIDLGFRNAFMVALIPFVLALVTYKLFTHMHSEHFNTNKKHVMEVKKGIHVEFKILRTLWRTAWPLFAFTFMIMFIDASFWTVGILLSEILKDTSKFGSLLLVAFMFPPVFAGLFAAKFNIKVGKKRIAFVTGLISAVFLTAVGFTKNVPLLIAFVALMSVFLNIAAVLHAAAIEDFVARLGDYGNDMVTMEQLAGSAAYIIGPIVLGYLAEVIGYQETFAVSGLLMGLVAFLCFIIVPRKVKMPQTELRNDISS